MVRGLYIEVCEDHQRTWRSGKYLSPIKLVYKTLTLAIYILLKPWGWWVLGIELQRAVSGDVCRAGGIGKTPSERDVSLPVKGISVFCRSCAWL